ncbi:MAG: hypothetical protein M3O70_21665 [Actinomycetota bacterium]|nr:hypothetical protein [Actinomycetota bacterium]
MENIRYALYEIAGNPDVPAMTVRQIFYQATTLGVVAKTEAEYKGTVVRLLTEMRRSGELPFGWIADNTRWMRKPTSHSSLDQALQRTAEAYRRSLWDDQDVYVEIWLEKEALAGVVFDITSEWDVPLMVTRGYPSLTYLYEAAEQIEGKSKSAYIYYLGDHDPSGVDISRNVEERLREFAPDADITFERLAVEPWQISAWGLPSRPTKTTDTRAKHFDGESVEVDAISPADLRAIVRTAIEQHVDNARLEWLQQVEASEREILQEIARSRS